MDSKNNNEREIELIEIILVILRKWRIIIIVTLIAGAVIGGYKMSNGLKLLNDTKYLEEQKQDVDTKWNAYLFLKENIEVEIKNLTFSLKNQKEYLSNSLLMGINPYNVFISEASVYIDTDFQILPGSFYQNDDYTDSIIGAYVSFINNKETYEFIKEQLGLDINIGYIQELIIVTPDIDSDLINIKVSYGSEGVSSKITGWLVDYLQSNKENITSTVGEHTFNIINKTDYSAVNSSLEEIQSEKMEKTKLLEKTLKDRIESLNTLATPSTYIVTKTSVLKDFIKFGVFGGMVSVILLIIFISGGFIISGKINNDKDIKKHFGLKIIAIFSQTKKKKAFAFIDRWIDKIEGTPERVSEVATYQIIAANIMAIAGDAKELLITGTIEESELRKIHDSLVNLVKPQNIILLCGENPVGCANTIKKIAYCDSVIIVEQRNRTTYKELEQVLELITNLDSEILGCILK